MLRAVPDGVTLAVRAQPGAKKTAITGIYGEGATAQLKIAVHAPPLEGRANAALIEFLAETFSVPRGAVELVSGEHSRSKVFLLRGVTMARATAVLVQRSKFKNRPNAASDKGSLGFVYPPFRDKSAKGWGTLGLYVALKKKQQQRQPQILRLSRRGDLAQDDRSLGVIECGQEITCAARARAVS